ncbi:MAG: hypothetical protein AAGH87_08555 [Pseudomonadota bacterium]
MVDITAGRRPARRAGALAQIGAKKTAARALVLASLAAGAGLAALAISPGASVAAIEAAGPELTRLLRGMAMIKAVLAGALLAGIHWRMAAPISALGLSVYSAAALALGAGFVMTWSLALPGAGAALLHLGLFGGLIWLARDPAVGQRLQLGLLSRTNRRARRRV